MISISVVLIAAAAAPVVVEATGTVAADDPIRKVYVLFSNHLDIGYTLNSNGSTSGAVVNQYFQSHFPKAIAVAAEARAKGAHPYKWMTQSWLVSAYRHCEQTAISMRSHSPSELQCPNASTLAAFEDAVRLGSISWHAFPFNAEPELFTPELFDAALNLTFAEDDYFGHPRRQTLSQRDVPGLTRAVIPLLARRGVVALSIGENSQVAPLAVPPIFVWRDNATATEVIALFHALGYGGSFPSTRISSGSDEPGPSIKVVDGRVEGASRSEACVSVDAAGVALCYAWKVDNSGPHSFHESQAIFEAVQALFPSAHSVVASDAFDDFIAEVLPHKASLPRVSAELGDTWIMGADADPKKVALFRAASRAHATCLKDGRQQCAARCISQPGLNETSHDTSEETLRGFERLLMVAGEHTWGWNGGHIRSRSWRNEELAQSLKTDVQFRQAVAGWVEQRAILRNAVASLPPDSSLARQIHSAWNEIEGPGTRTRWSHDPGLVEVSRDSKVVCKTDTGQYEVVFGSDGAIRQLVWMYGGVHQRRELLADAAHPLARIHYQNMDAEYFKRYVSEYVAGISEVWPELTAENLYKPRLDTTDISSNFTLLRLYTNHANRILLDLRVSERTAHTERGAPAEVQAELRCGARNRSIAYTLRWFDKTPTHTPETMWLSHVPLQLADLASPLDQAVRNISGRGRVKLDKLGMMVDATDVDLSDAPGCADSEQKLTCGVHLHGVGDGGVTVFPANESAGAAVRFASRDSAIVSVGQSQPVPTPLVVPKLDGGVHFALVGNIWNTNCKRASTNETLTELLAGLIIILHTIDLLVLCNVVSDSHFVVSDPFWYPFVGEDHASQFRFTMDFLHDHR